MTTFPDWRPAPNIRDAPDLYEIENEAIDPDSALLDAMRDIAPWAGRSLLDLGCGTGFWLPRYAAEAATVIGVEPDPDLRRRAAERCSDIVGVRIVAGSAEHLPLDEASVDVVHARFAYFFGAGAEAGLHEVLRVVRPGGALVVVDNDYSRGEFADLLHAATEGNAAFDPAATDRWWHAAGARRVPVMSRWRFAAPADLAGVLRNEFRDGTADDWLSRHPGRVSLTYGYVLFAVDKPSGPVSGL